MSIEVQTVPIAEIIMVNDLNCLQMSLSGFKNHYKFVIDVRVNGAFTFFSFSLNSKISPG